MPAEASGGDVSARIRALEQKFDRLQAANASLKSTSRIMTILLAVTAVVLVYRLVEPLLDLYQSRQTVVNTVMKDAEERLIPAIQSEAKLLVEKDLKVWIEAELPPILEKKAPEVSAVLEKEGALLLETLRARFEENMKQRAEKFNVRYQDKLKAEFPQLFADPKTSEKVLSNLQLGLDTASDRILDDFFRQHREALLQIGKDFDRLSVPGEVTAKANSELVDEALSLLMEMVGSKFDIATQVTSQNAPNTPAAGK